MDEKIPLTEMRSMNGIKTKEKLTSRQAVFLTKIIHRRAQRVKLKG